MPCTNTAKLFLPCASRIQIKRMLIDVSAHEIELRDELESTVSCSTMTRRLLAVIGLLYTYNCLH
jgi:hypothetical protein